MHHRFLDTLLSFLTGAERVGTRHPAGGALKGKKTSLVPLHSSKYRRYRQRHLISSLSPFLKLSILNKNTVAMK